MRLVAVADTHTFEGDLGRVPDGDVFVHAGDLCRAGTLAEFKPVAQWLRSLPHPHKLVVAGNHDWCFLRNRDDAIDMLGPDIVYLRDQAIELNGLKFWGSPWQPEFLGWAFNLPRGPALAEKWALIPEATNVLITHGPPRGFGDRTSVQGRSGCDDLLQAVRRLKPALHLFGHIHEDGGFFRGEHTCFSNVTTWECERGATVIDIDPVSKSVTDVVVPRARGE